MLDQLSLYKMQKSINEYYSVLDSIRMKTWLLRVTLYTIIWLVLTDGAMESWPVGIPVILFSTLVSVILLPPLSFSLYGIFRFIPYFLWYSLRGGLDVALRAIQIPLAISPGLVDYPFRLPPGLPRVFMANTVSLLPGTLSVELYDEVLHVHVLDKTGAINEELNLLENRLADLFGIELNHK